MNSDLSQSFYRCYFESVVTFPFILWFGVLSVKNKSKLNKAMSVSSEIVGRRLCNLSDLYERRVITKSMNSTGNTSHILDSQYAILQSGKCLSCFTVQNREKSSFIPTSVKLLNKYH